MVRVNILSKDEIVYGLEVKGHADFATSGKDLICAGVSCIITGGFNAFNKEDIEEITLEDGYAKVILKPGSESLKVLDTIIIQLQTIQEGYSKYIQIK
ncbi:MAG: ribosomal-processing cysteine protease Prp [Bacillales bacterium]|nr:ribosomal-processing cysteine protease Prp [Bacillales bacterium]